MEEDKVDLTVSQLPTQGAVVVLGALAVRALQEQGVVTFFVTLEGNVEICPPGELELDGVEQQEALRVLLERDYTDDQLVAYLRGRNARLSRGTL